jgi:hypothetical protein
MKFKLILKKEFNIDTKVHWGNDHTTLIETLRDQISVAPGDEAGPDEIHDAIRAMLESDIEYVVDLSLDENDFEIFIPPDTTIEVPAEDEDDAA